MAVRDLLRCHTSGQRVNGYIGEGARDGGGRLDEPPTANSKWFREAWINSGKKLNMGKACIRFKRAEDVPLDVVGEAIRRVPVKKCIGHYQKASAESAKGGAVGR